MVGLTVTLAAPAQGARCSLAELWVLSQSEPDLATCVNKREKQKDNNIQRGGKAPEEFLEWFNEGERGGNSKNSPMGRHNIAHE